MAFNEHIEILRHGVDVWNKWRQDMAALPDLRGANLRGADLRGVHLQDAHLAGANLQNADLRAADPLDTDPWGGPTPRGSFHAPYLLGGLGDTSMSGGVNRLWTTRQPEKSRANLWAAEMWAANLEGATLRGADLREIRLRGANLQYADLQDADLRGADLRDTTLWGVNLRGADVRETDVRSARVGQTIFSGLDLSRLHGLETVHHLAPSIVDLDTLERTSLALTESPSRQEKIHSFCRRAGLNEHMLQLIDGQAGSLLPEFHNCYISYSHADKAFARWLYKELQERGVRCWLHEHEADEDDDHLGMVDNAVRLHDRVLFCCSKASMSSWWVEDEIERALDREKQLGKDFNQKVHTLIGLNLDGFLFEKKWKRARERQLKARLIADFSGWQKKSAKLDAPLERVLQTLRVTAPPTANS